MGKAGRPRFGSMGVWPRVRAKSTLARVRSTPISKEAKPLAFAAYKAGMTKVLATGIDKNKRSANITTSVPVTILECPPMKIASARLYKKGENGLVVDTQLNFKTEKELLRKQPAAKTTEKLASEKDIEKLKADDYDDITIQVYTQPKLTNIKKTPEIFEVKLGGSNQEKLDYIKNNIHKPISAVDTFKEGQLVDLHAVTTGRGFQGPVKRFGIGLKPTKSEKGRRNPGSLGGWKGQAHVMYRVAHAGQTGYHQRTQYNNLLLKMGDKPEDVNLKGGIIRFGVIKNPYILIAGTVPGPKKRLVTITQPIRPHIVKQQFKADSIVEIKTDSPQGR